MESIIDKLISGREKEKLAFEINRGELKEWISLVKQGKSEFLIGYIIGLATKNNDDN